MIELSFKLPATTYNELQAMAGRQRKSVSDLVVQLISQRFSSATPSQPVWAEQKHSRSSAHQFVTDWALPDQYQQIEQNAVPEKGQDVCQSSQ